MKEKIKCCNCKYCKIWYDESTYTMRISCTRITEHGKTIYQSSFPLFTKQNGIGVMIRTDDTLESITKEFEDYTKRRLAPYWCYYRINNELPEPKEEVKQYKYFVPYIYFIGGNNVHIESANVYRDNLINSFKELDEIKSALVESISSRDNLDPKEIELTILNFISVG